MLSSSFWWSFAGKVGAPIFGGTLVACLLSGQLDPLHGILMGVGIGMIALSHWHAHHHDSDAPPSRHTPTDA